MTALIPNRSVPYPVRVPVPSGAVHKYYPGGVINVDVQSDVEWLVNTGDWQYANAPVNDTPDVEPVEVEVTESDELSVATMSYSLPHYEDLTKKEWVKLADTYGVSVDSSASKQAVYDAIWGALNGA